MWNLKAREQQYREMLRKISTVMISWLGTREKVQAYDGSSGSNPHTGMHVSPESV